MVESEQLLTRAEVAELLQVPEATLARWAYMGQGPTYFRVGRWARYRRSEVLAWLDGQRRVGQVTAAAAR